MATPTVETLIQDIRDISALFRGDNSRITKVAARARFIDSDQFSEEARLLVSDALDRVYSGVVWEDDVFAHDIPVTLEVLAMRVRKTADK